MQVMNSHYVQYADTQFTVWMGRNLLMWAYEGWANMNYNL